MKLPCSNVLTLEGTAAPFFWVDGQNMPQNTSKFLPDCVQCHIPEDSTVCSFCHENLEIHAHTFVATRHKDT